MGFRCLQRDLYDHEGPFTICGLNLQLTSDLLKTLADCEQAKAGLLLIGGMERGLLNPDAVVFHGNPDMVIQHR